MTAGVSPAVGREVLDAPTREIERVLLLTRIREGIDIESLHAGGRHAVAGLIADELVDAKAALSGGLVLTEEGGCSRTPSCGACSTTEGRQLTNLIASG